MARSLNVGGDHPDVAETLLAMVSVCQLAGDFGQESWRVIQSLRGDKNGPSVAETFDTLGPLSKHAGDLQQAKQHLEESLRMSRNLNGGKDDPDIAETLHSLGSLNRKAGNFQQAKQNLEESLRMSRALYGDQDHPSIATRLFEKGLLSKHTDVASTEVSLAMGSSEKLQRCCLALTGYLFPVSNHFPTTFQPVCLEVFFFRPTCQFPGMFAVITPALMTGAFADRFRFKPYLIFIVLWLLLLCRKGCLEKILLLCQYSVSICIEIYRNNN